MAGNALGNSLVQAIASAAGTADLDFHQGLVMEWHSSTGHNVIRVAGADVPDVPVLSSAGLVQLAPGDAVMVMRYKSVYYVAGRVFSVGSGLVQPQWPIVLYPLFVPLGTPGADGPYWTVSPGVKTSWEGRLRVSHPLIEVDGIWGRTGGTGSIIYALFVNNIEVGRWTTPSGNLAVGHGSEFAGLSAGGFDVSQFLGQDWRGIRLSIVENTSTNSVAFTPLGVFFRQS